MRDLVLVLYFAVLLPLSFRFPVAGLYLWVFVSLMNPHRLAYGFAAALPFNFAIAICTVIGWLTSSERRLPQGTPFLTLYLTFVAWFTLTTFTVAVSPEAYELWSRNTKTAVLIILTLSLINSKVRVHGLVWIIVMSLGYFSLRNGILTIASGGTSHMEGPPDSMITDNNCLALALTMTFPLMLYLYRCTRNRLPRLGLIAAMATTVLAVLGSYSRGGLIAMAATLAYLVARSRSRIIIGLLGLVAFGGALYLMPEQFLQRAQTIGDAGNDDSFQSRLQAWDVSWRTALDHPLGVGFDGPRQPQIWFHYRFDGLTHAAHSIYFMVLGEHGFLGLTLFLVMIYSAWRAASRTIKLIRNVPSAAWLRELASMCQASVVGFCVGGAALAMSYYDGFALILAIMSTLPHLAENELKHAAHREESRSNDHQFDAPLPPVNAYAK